MTENVNEWDKCIQCNQSRVNNETEIKTKFKLCISVKVTLLQYWRTIVYILSWFIEHTISIFGEMFFSIHMMLDI